MRVCVVGAGAIGGLMGAKLALAGNDVTLVARGPHLDAIRTHGLKLVLENGDEVVVNNVAATSIIAEASLPDFVVLALKAHQIAPIVDELAAIIGPNTTLVSIQNGIPWWYFQKHGGEYEGRHLESVDPNGYVMAAIDVERVVGCVVYPAAQISEPGVIRHIEGHRFPVGELDGRDTSRIRSLSEAFSQAGMKSPVLTDLRAEIWLKLWGNLSFNPISALTHATLVDICQFPLTRQLAAAMMTEAQTVANKLGIQFRVPLEKRIAGAEAVGKHKTSMLQDVELGRPIEVDALLGSVVELGRLTNTPTPHLDAVYSCAGLLSMTLSDEHGRLRIEALPHG